MQDPLDFRGKVVLVTGGAKGVGRGITRRFLECGANVVICGRQAPERLPSGGGRQAVFMQCAVRDIEQLEQLLGNVLKFFGRLDVLINNAGLGGSRALVEMPDEEWNRVIDVTLTGTMRMTRAMLPYMMERRAGVIVNNASVLGWRAQKQQAHYAAAKAGVMALTRCAAVEAAEHGIRINAVSPSIAMHDFLARSAPQAVLDQLAANEAFGRAAEVWEVANVMMFLASDYSSYMTGDVLSVSSQRA